ncbi:M1 family metallopeptidase [Zavarzinella formosa]|uniref:M1 family metallopeptidase n=1 Tax=Zavarzinella formosa TaxID=360055 RepID=UPI00036CFCE4|nr:M1 family metallopeptidase [Zavarzinella formosa]
MRALLTIIGVCWAALAASAVERKAPEWLPRYDIAMHFDLPGHKVEVTQNVSWVNRTNKPVEDIVFNVHSHYQPPKNPVDRLFLAKMLEIMRVPAREGIYDDPALIMRKVEQLHKQGDVWTRKEVHYRFKSDMDTAMVVPLPRPLPPGESVVLALTYSMDLPQRQGRWGQWEGVTFLSNWHPVVAYLDPEKGWQPTPFVPWHQPFYNEAGVFTVRAKLPKEQKIACTGPIVSTKEIGNEQEVEIGPVTARDFSFLCSDRYKEYIGDADGVKVRCMAFPEHEFYAEVLIKYSSRALQAYTKWFGPYPYKEFNIAESYFGWNGNECCGLVMIDERVFSMPHFAEGYVAYLISHETGHQWWYNMVGTDGFRETFMDEAFATYFSHRLLNQEDGKNNALLKFPKGLGWLPGIKREDYRYGQFYSTLRKGELGPAVQEMTKYRHIGNLFSAAYDRGGKIVGMLEERLGEAAFMDFMRRIHSRYYFKVIHAEDFKRELEEYTGKSWDDFFKHWLTQNGMTDWSLVSVDVQPAPTPTEIVRQAGATDDPRKDETPKEMYKATVIIRQKAEYDEPTTLGFSFDDGVNYNIRIPIVTSDGTAKFQNPMATVEPLDDHRVKIEVMLPAKPNQVCVDPDQVLPDSEPANNFWKPPVRYRVAPFYTFLEETTYTTAYDRLNVITGPWFYGASYADPWFTRATVLGLRAGVYRTEEFSGGVYTGYRSTYRDLATGFDGNIRHWPLPNLDLGFHGEKSLVQLTKNSPDLDRGAIWARYVIDESPSLYSPPMHHVEAFGSWQQHFLPAPRHTIPGAYEFDQATNVGVHYHIDLLTPYWDPEVGFKLDATYALGVPILGQEVVVNQVFGQASWVQAPPEGLGWLSQTRLALRAFGAWGSKQDGRLFALGGDLNFRGFDLAERQGSAAWLGSVEWRMPVYRKADIDAVDHFVRLKNMYVAPFYDVGDIYLSGKSLGPVAHAVGLGFRFDVAWFSFLERTMLRVDVAKTVNVNSPTQFWFGIQHPF